MKPEYKQEAVLRLKIAAGHLDSVRRMADHDTYCIDLMKQLSAVQASLERVQQIFLRNHLSTCVSKAIKEGMGEELIDELMEALKFNKSLTDGRHGVPLLGIIPTTRAVSAISEGLSWNYTTVLNIVFLAVAAVLVLRFLRTGGPAMLRLMNTPEEVMAGMDHHALGHGTSMEGMDHAGHAGETTAEHEEHVGHETH